MSAIALSMVHEDPLSAHEHVVAAANAYGCSALLVWWGQRASSWIIMGCMAFVLPEGPGRAMQLGTVVLVH